MFGIDGLLIDVLIVNANNHTIKVIGIPHRGSGLSWSATEREREESRDPMESSALGPVQVASSVVL